MEKIVIKIDGNTDLLEEKLNKVEEKVDRIIMKLKSMSELCGRLDSPELK